ncbi:MULTISPECIES: cyanophycinase [Chryseobacterium]|uniref:Cyanophycinase n=2 Tax=Chryseobacterium taihuense TaxID=1141221 RepID=A0A4U8WA92_9FLAO|nr:MULTISPECIES: cyanophycinase [Chryseobacterium]QQV04287.1 cyanophycinase [Chryseobacterium sp. FDAARGOS 1104]VFB02346.1 Cyanophycinase [Chryseobacterium taihuense]
MDAKGKLLIIGGHEDRSDNHVDMKEANNHFSSYEILKLLAESNDQRIEIITTASSEPEDMRKTYNDTFSKIGFSNFGFMHPDDESKNEEYIERIKQAKTVFFTGGDQNNICKKLNNSPINTVLRERYYNDKDFMVAGTSAGAMCMPEIIIIEAENGEAIIDNDIQLGKGLGLLNNSIVDTHFVHRGRFGRLAHAVLKNEELFGLGLGEDTALLIENGSRATCKGSGMVIVISAKEVIQTNVETADKHHPIYAENLKVHLLTHGCVINLSEGIIEKGEC